MINKEQEEEFKQRKAAGPKFSSEELKPQKLTPKQLQAFLKATDSKCNGDS